MIMFMFKVGVDETYSHLLLVSEAGLFWSDALPVANQDVIISWRVVSIQNRFAFNSVTYAPVTQWLS